MEKTSHICPVKYSTFNWPSSNGLVAVNTDGSVSVQHGLRKSVKVFTHVLLKYVRTLWVVLWSAFELWIRIDVMPNMPVTGGSVSTGSASQAVRLACYNLDVVLHRFLSRWVPTLLRIASR